MRALIFIEAHGKAEAWGRIAGALGMSARVVATGGHICRFPAALHPIGIRLEQGERLDYTRRIAPDQRDRILAEIDDVPLGTALMIATDSDVEGDVIALDLIELIMQNRKDRAVNIMRVRPGAINIDGIRKAIHDVAPIGKELPHLVTSAIHGRARGVTDRWIGAAFSKIAGVPVGRVRSAVFGNGVLVDRRAEFDAGRPETGELTFQARSGSGGRPFQARVPLMGEPMDANMNRLVALAQRYAGRLIPGIVRPRSSLSAAVAPRFGSVAPFNTGDALAYASRHYAINPTEAMRGLQDSYLKGMISYPRTESREVGVETAGRIARLGVACGLQGMDPYHLATPAPSGSSDRAHEALHPVCGIKASEVAALSQVVRRNVAHKPTYDRNEIADLMTAMIARRSFEAARQVVLEVGAWRADNTPASADLTAEDIDALRDLEWEREVAPSFPWGRDLMTGSRIWPVEAVLLDGMMTEGIGRPSTFAAHIQTAMASGDIEPGQFGGLPQPSPQGVTSLKRIPRAIWNPATCRMIEVALENADNRLGEDVKANLHVRSRFRVITWFSMLPEAIQDALIGALEQEDGTTTPAARENAQPAATQKAVSSPAAANAPAEAPYEMSTELDDPTPFGA